MSIVLFLALAMILALLGLVAGLLLLARFLTSDAAEDRAMRFDPFARPLPKPLSARFVDFFLRWRHGPKQLTYRRDARGRFRKRDR